MSVERITVMGIGNPLMMDEGVGVRVMEVMMGTLQFPDNVTLIDAGTMGMGILNLFQECDYLLVIDAVDGTGEPPGTVVRLTPEDLAPNQVKHSMHDVRLVDVLEAAMLMGNRPEADCIGIQIADMGRRRDRADARGRGRGPRRGGRDARDPGGARRDRDAVAESDSTTAHPRSHPHLRTPPALARPERRSGRVRPSRSAARTVAAMPPASSPSRA